MDPLDFTGRAVVVTGGTRGIGAAIAAAFQAAGADVLICGRTPPDPASAPASPVPSAPAPSSGSAPPAPAASPPVPSSGSAPPGLGPSLSPDVSAPRAPVFLQADVRDPVQAKALIDAAVERFGRVDVLINNAGGSPEVPAVSASPRLHAKIIELNLIAPLHVAQAANAVMREQATGGVILMIGSVSGTRPSPGTAAYGAAKAGLHHLATSLAAEWAPRVRVNTLVVGPVEAEPVAVPASSLPSPGRGHAPQVADGAAGAGAAGGAATAGAGGGAAASTVARAVPMGRAARAGEVASACLLLASPLAGYISGASLAVHGGGEWPAYLADLRDTAYRAEK